MCVIVCVCLGVGCARGTRGIDVENPRTPDSQPLCFVEVASDFGGRNHPKTHLRQKVRHFAGCPLVLIGEWHDPGIGGNRTGRVMYEGNLTWCGTVALCRVCSVLGHFHKLFYNLLVYKKVWENRVKPYIPYTASWKGVILQRVTRHPKIPNPTRNRVKMRFEFGSGFRKPQTLHRGAGGESLG